MKTIITQASTTRPPGVFEVKRYGDPWMSAMMGLSYKQQGSNFQNVSLFAPGGGFGAVTKFQRLDAPAVAYLRGIQKPDKYSVAEKMAWLWGEGRPYFDVRDAPVFGTIVFGGQLVQVETVNDIPQPYEFMGQYQQDPINAPHPILFYKLLGLRAADFGKFTHASHPWLIQKCTSVGVGDRYIDTPRGTIYHPVWSPLDYPSNYGWLYIARSFLVGF